MGHQWQLSERDSCLFFVFSQRKKENPILARCQNRVYLQSAPAPLHTYKPAPKDSLPHPAQNKARPKAPNHPPPLKSSCILPPFVRTAFIIKRQKDPNNKKRAAFPKETLLKISRLCFFPQQAHKCTDGSRCAMVLVEFPCRFFLWRGIREKNALSACQKLFRQ